MADVNIQEDWKTLLKDEFNKDYFKNLIHFVKSEYKTSKVFPPGKQIFSAFDHTPPQNVKVVIIGQDPYHGEGQANGLCFSVADHIAQPPSLINIFKEIQEDLGTPPQPSGNLESWADQGVFLLNASLTVKAHQAGSHQGKGWETFTDTVIQKLSDEYKNIVFMLWGGFAKRKESLINKNNGHFILKSGHPSPLSANRGYWFGNKHFSKANEFLKSKNIQPIIW